MPSSAPQHYKPVASCAAGSSCNLGTWTTKDSDREAGRINPIVLRGQKIKIHQLALTGFDCLICKGNS